LEYLVGKQSREMTGAELLARGSDYQKVLVDIGTGDGAFVYQQAKAHPAWLVIGVDACRENLVDISRRGLPNALYLIANVEKLPPELTNLTDVITVNFPWGSLLTGLLDGGDNVLTGLSRLARAGARLEMRLNGSAIAKEGYPFEAVCTMVRRNSAAHGFRLSRAERVGSATMRSFPSTWAKRLAYGKATEFWLLSFTAEDAKDAEFVTSNTKSA
jgi:16S rRNA (adenine(1408)-N(1))-methyltransferase